MAVLKRQPDNPYDSNAIKVENLRRAQVGHVKKECSTKLAKVMDRNLARTECLVSGLGNEYVIPLQIKVYAMSSNEAEVTKLLGGWLRSTSASRQKGVSGDGGSGGRSGGTAYRKVSNQQVLKEVDQLLAKCNNPDLPMADQPARVATELLPHQRQALLWMQEKESTNALPPFWSEKVAKNRQGKTMRGNVVVFCFFCKLLCEDTFVSLPAPLFKKDLLR